MAPRRKAARAALEVDVQYAAEDAAGLPAPRAIETWVAAALAGRAAGAQLTVRIVAEAEGRELNERYRGCAGPTNVLSFPFENPDLLQPPLLGDVVLCAPVVRREAAAQGKMPEAHWAHLVVHGVLHLLGYDHEEEVEAAAMEGLETRILATLGFPDPYAAEKPPAAAPRARRRNESSDKVRKDQ
jgi:probable rRNA maturation factor